MMISKKVVVTIILIVVLTLTSAAAYAITNIGHINKEKVVDDDVFVADQAVSNEGIIKGDFFAAGQSVVNSGTIEGDMLSASGDLTLEGKVLGDARVAAGSVTIRGAVDKNINIFAGNIDMKNSAVTGRNLLIAGGTVNIEGKVNGKSRIYGDKVTLSGEFMGDVEVYVEDAENKSPRGLVVKKNAIIHGKLIYKGLSEAVIEDGAQINELQWEKVELNKADNKEKGPDKYLWDFIKLVLTALVYFSIGFFIYKVFPKYFIRSGGYISGKPLNTIGVGLVAIIAILASFIVFVVLILMAIGLISHSVGLVFGLAATAAYVLLFYFSTIPVAVWLGGLLLRSGAYSEMKRFGIGLAVVTGGFYILKLLSDIPAYGFVFSLISFTAGFIFSVLGIGALLYVIRDLLSAARKDALNLE